MIVPVAQVDSPGAIEAGVDDEGLRATALINLGAAEMWAGQLDAAERHLDHGLDEVRRIGRPRLELQALSDLALLSMLRDRAAGEERAREAIELARAHGWEETAPFAATAYLTLGGAALWRGRLAEAEGWLDLAEIVLQRYAQPTTAMMLYGARAVLEFARDRPQTAMTASAHR
jgi:hypothetical protein